MRRFQLHQLELSPSRHSFIPSSVRILNELSALPPSRPPALPPSLPPALPPSRPPALPPSRPPSHPPSHSLPEPLILFALRLDYDLFGDLLLLFLYLLLLLRYITNFPY